MNRIQTLVDERNELAAGLSYVRSALDAEDLATEDFDAGADYCRTAAELIAELDRKIDSLEAIERTATDPRNVTRGDAPGMIVSRDPFDVSDVSMLTGASELRGRARTAIEQVRHLDDGLREAATSVIERAQDKRGEIPMRMLLTGTEAYRSAFQKVVSYNEHALTEEERGALARAASLTGNAGGFAVPFTLDPTIILTNNGSANAIRQLARTIPIATDEWNGVSSAGVTAGYAAEAAEAGDNAPTLAQPSITVRKGHAFVPFSIEIGMDWVGMESDVRMLIADGKDTADATVFWSGVAGSNQPIGIETALAGGASVVATDTAEVLAVGDLSKVYAALPPRYRNANTAAIAEWSTLVEARRLLAAADDRSSFNEATAGQPATLFGYPILEHSTCDAFSAVNAAADATNHLMVVGDWSNYVIVDRVGLTVELVPHLFATGNNRPSGQRGFYAFWRTGADSVNDAAFRVLTLTTEA